MSKWVFPASKPDAIAKRKPRNSLVRILDRHYCSSSVFITCQCAHAHISDDGTKRKQTKRAHNNGTRATRAATPFWWRHDIDSFGYFPDWHCSCLFTNQSHYKKQVQWANQCTNKQPACSQRYCAGKLEHHETTAKSTSSSMIPKVLGQWW